MIKATTIQTFEIDDIHAACNELKKQLSEKLVLQANSIGIVQSDPEFVSSGLGEILYKELGLPLVGGTTIASATNEGLGNSVLSILILTSDDVRFADCHTSGLIKNNKKAIEESLQPCLGEPVKLVMVFPPAFDEISNDSYIEAFEGAFGKVPIFGTNNTDEQYPLKGHSYSIHNDLAYTNELSYILFYGNINPRFYVAQLPAQANLTEVDTIITKSSENIVQEFNNILALKYFEKLGFAHEGTLKTGTEYLPILVSEESEANMRPHVRALLSIDDKGYALCSGKMPKDAKITFGSCKSSDIMSATIETVTEAVKNEDISAALIFSCIVRQLAFGIDSMKELKQIKEILPKNLPFIASYSGGEFSPINIGMDDPPQNRYHNYSLVICML